MNTQASKKSTDSKTTDTTICWGDLVDDEPDTQSVQAPKQRKQEPKERKQESSEESSSSQSSQSSQSTQSSRSSRKSSFHSQSESESESASASSSDSVSVNKKGRGPMNKQTNVYNRNQAPNKNVGQPKIQQALKQINSINRSKKKVEDKPVKQPQLVNCIVPDGFALVPISSIDSIVLNSKDEKKKNDKRNVATEIPPNAFTKRCKFGDKCNRRDTCTFIHNDNRTDLVVKTAPRTKPADQPTDQSVIAMLLQMKEEKRNREKQIEVAAAKLLQEQQRRLKKKRELEVEQQVIELIHSQQKKIHEETVRFNDDRKIAVQLFCEDHNIDPETITPQMMKKILKGKST